MAGKPQHDVSPAGSGTIQEKVLETSYYWYATIYHWQFTANANLGYEFDHWEYDSDDGWGGPIEHSSTTYADLHVSWAILQPEYAESHQRHDYGTVRATAYFRKTGPTPGHTGLILRSSASGIILRGSSGQILRDE